MRRDGDGPELLDTIVALSVGAPSFPGVARALRSAAGGDRAPLRRLVAEVHRAQAAPRRFFSAGLHAATLCADIRAPWGRPDAPSAPRAARRRRAPAPPPGSGRALRPRDRHRQRLDPPLRAVAPDAHARVTGNGTLPPVPALLLAGDRDLSTPMPWPRAQLARTPRGRLLVVPTPGTRCSRAPAIRACGAR